MSDQIIVAAEVSSLGAAYANNGQPKRLQPLEPIKQLKAGVLDVGYCDMGASDGPPVLLLHGWPYDMHSYADVAPMLAARGCRVIVPHLRGHGTTRFLDSATPRSGQQASIGADVIALMDALKMPRGVLAGYDWGGRAACVAAALWPERCTGLVSVNSYLIQDIAKAGCRRSRWTGTRMVSSRQRMGNRRQRSSLLARLARRLAPSQSRTCVPVFAAPPAFPEPLYPWRSPTLPHLAARVQPQGGYAVPLYALRWGTLAGLPRGAGGAGGAGGEAGPLAGGARGLQGAHS